MGRLLLHLTVALIREIREMREIPEMREMRSGASRPFVAKARAASGKRRYTAGERNDMKKSPS